MKKYFLLSAFGKDKPGLVAAVTKSVLDLGGNIEDASMTRLGGEFCIMLVTSVAASATLPAMEKRLALLRKSFALETGLKAIPASLARGASAGGTRYMISVYGTDKPGIVYQVARALAERKINITDLNTKAVAQGRSSVYVMFLEIQVSPAVDIDELRTDLDRLRTTLDVEITLQDIDAAAL